MSTNNSKSGRDARGKKSVNATFRAGKGQPRRSTWEVSTEQSANFAGFPNENWEAATPESLRPAVCILREKIQEMAGAHFFKFEQDAYEDLHEYRAKGRESIRFSQHLDRLQRHLAADATFFYSNDFRRIAAANPHLVEGDPLNWAYAQIRSTLCEFIGLPEGNKLKELLICVSDHRPTDTHDDLVSLVKARLKRAASWRAPLWVYTYFADKLPEKQYAPEDAWKRATPEMTEAVFAKFVRDFWLVLEARLLGHVRDVRVSLAQQSNSRAAPNPPDDVPAGNLPTASPANDSKVSDRLVTRVAKKLKDPQGSPTMTVDEVAHAFSKSKSCIYRWISEGIPLGSGKIQLTWVTRGRISTDSVRRALPPA